MKKLILILLSSLLISCSDSGPNTETKEQIIVTANAIANASTNENTPGLMKHLTKDVKIEVRTSDQKSESYNFNSYKKYVSRVFSLISNYQGKRSHESFESLANDGYLYKFTLTERYVFDNQNLFEVHNQVWHLRKVDDVYKIYKIIVNP